MHIYIYLCVSWMWCLLFSLWRHWLYNLILEFLELLLLPLFPQIHFSVCWLVGLDLCLSLEALLKLVVILGSLFIFKGEPPKSSIWKLVLCTGVVGHLPIGRPHSGWSQGGLAWLFRWELRRVSISEVSPGLALLPNWGQSSDFMVQGSSLYRCLRISIISPIAQFCLQRHMVPSILDLF